MFEWATVILDLQVSYITLLLLCLFADMLLYGVGAQHVINFLAVLDIPMPMPGDTSLVVSSSPEDVTSVPSPATSNVATAPKSPSTPDTFPQPQNQGVDLDSGATESPKDSELPMIPPVEIKEERVEEEKACSGEDQQSLSPKASCGKKRKLSTSCGKKNQKTRAPQIAVEEESDFNPSDAELEETKEPESGLPDVSFQAVEMSAASLKSAERKYYRCPLCPRILPSSRGFNIHVGRKHQVSNYQGNWFCFMFLFLYDDCPFVVLTSMKKKKEGKKKEKKMDSILVAQHTYIVFMRLDQE